MTKEDENKNENKNVMLRSYRMVHPIMTKYFFIQKSGNGHRQVIGEGRGVGNKMFSINHPYKQTELCRTLHLLMFMCPDTS